MITYDNPLYPSDEDVSDLEAATRETEYFDDTNLTLKNRRQRKRKLWSDEDDSYSVE